MTTVRVLLQPKLLVLHVVALVAVLLAAALGWWQVEAWQEHRRDRAGEVGRLEPVPLASLIGPDAAFPREGVGVPVTFAGEWRPEETVLIAGRPHDSELGLWVVTPVSVCEAAPCPDAPAMPVVVGWTPDEQTPLTPPRGEVDLTGWLQPGEPNADEDPDLDDDVLPALRTTDLLDRVDGDLYAAYVVMDGPASARGSLVAVTPDSYPDPPAFTALRNLLYGLEWWFFGGFAIFMWVRWCRDEVAAAHVRPVSPDGSPAEDAELAPSPAGLPSDP